MTIFVTPSISIGNSFTAGKAYEVRPGLGRTHEVTSDLGHPRVISLEDLGSRSPHLVPDLYADFPGWSGWDGVRDEAEWEAAGHFTACDASAEWLVKPDAKPIPTRAHDWDFCHRDYDGPEDDRCGTGSSIEDCLEQIAERANA